MIKDVLVSVIIPTYKPGGYIYGCLESLFGQTLDCGFFEIVIVLNGCNEPYISDINRYVNEKKGRLNIRVLQTDTPGVSNARNLGISKSKGNYIIFIDDDDWVSPNYLYNLTSAANKTEDIVVSNVWQVMDGSYERVPHYLTYAYQKCSALDKLTFYNTRSFLSSACAKLIPRGIIGSARFDERFRLGEDSLFMFQISKNIKRITLAPADTVYYVRKRAESASRKTYAYSYRMKLAFALSFRYLAIFMSAPFKYDFVLFLTRVAATMRKLFQKKYRS